MSQCVWHLVAGISWVYLLPACSITMWQKPLFLWSLALCAPVAVLGVWGEMEPCMLDLLLWAAERETLPGYHVLKMTFQIAVPLLATWRNIFSVSAQHFGYCLSIVVVSLPGLRSSLDKGANLPALNAGAAIHWHRLSFFYFHEC